MNFLTFDYAINALIYILEVPSLTIFLLMFNITVIISQDFCRLTVNLTVRMLFVKSGINILLSLLKLFFIPLPTNNILAAGFQYITDENLSNLGKDLCCQNRVVWITKQGSGACYATSEIICSNVERKFFCW